MMVWKETVHASGDYTCVKMSPTDRDELITALQVMQELCCQFGTSDHHPHLLTIEEFAARLRNA